MTIESIELWHKRARPEPSEHDFNVQLGVHLEELAEMLECVHGTDDDTDDQVVALRMAVGEMALTLKKAKGWVRITPGNRKAFLDSLADQIVTAVGVGHCAGMQTAKACERVNTSNWSKYDENGQPTFDANGKIAKPATYVAPDLEGLYG
jgi:predicted HAD superfamily Cof-like phosphohydrolase